MSRVNAAVEAGQCAVAVSGALLRDADVMLAFSERAGLVPMALSGPAQSPVVGISDAVVARAVAAPNGVLLIVDPGPQDQMGMTRIAQMISSAPNKPTVVVVARNFNPLQMRMMFPGMKVEHVRERSKAFVQGLPVPPAGAATDVGPTVASAKERRKALEPQAPRLAFVGREHELAKLVGILGDGGPVVVSGPRGVGRSWLVAHAVAEAGLTVLPELTLGRGAGADTLFARLAAITKAGGSDILATCLAGPHTPAEAVKAAVEALQGAEGCANQMMVIRDLQVASGRDGTFFRKSRLEMLIEALLTHTYPLRLVFLSVNQPVFFREGRDAGLRRVKLAGIMGRFFHDIFEAYKAPEFSRDKFGPLNEKLHGHPLAVRTYAIAVRTSGVALLDDDKFLKMEDLADSKAMGRYLERRLEKLSKPLRGFVAAVAHFPVPVDASMLVTLGISKKDRTKLLSEGLIDMVGVEGGEKRYRVNDYLRRALGPRETADFDLLGEIGGAWNKKAAGADEVTALAYGQEANRCFLSARRFRDYTRLAYPDQDAVVESCYGLMRSREPRFEMAADRIDELIKQDPSNSDAHLLKLELLRRTDAKAETVNAAIDAALATAAVPEVFHQAVGFHLSRKGRGKAIKVLEDAVAALPDQSRLRTRLASLLLRQGRRPEAIEHLRAAMDLDPMLPDAYGLLGQAKREEGRDALGDAETLLREAVRLAPGDVVQTSRLIWLLLDIAKGVPERTAEAREEIKSLLDALLVSEKDSAEVHLVYAVALREEGADIARARWFLKKAQKFSQQRRGPKNSRFIIESCLLDLAEGSFDDAEKRLRGLAAKEPSNHRVFGALALVLEARGSLVAAHAELQRARERTSVNSLDRQNYDEKAAHLANLISGGYTGLMAAAAAEASAAAATPVEAAAEEAPVEAVADLEAAAVEAAEVEAAPVEVAPEAAPVEAAAEEAPVEAASAEAAPVDAEVVEEPPAATP